MENLDTAFAKVYSDFDGRDYIAVSGHIIPLAIENLQHNNAVVREIVSGMRKPRTAFVGLSDGQIGTGRDFDSNRVRETLND